MNPTFLSVVLTTIWLSDMAIGVDYCQAGLCRPGIKHIGCGATDNFGPKCPTERSLVPITADLKAYLLKKHNQGRSDISNGKISGYTTANRMIEMTWDDELSKLAEYNAKTCTYAHDTCHNTVTYKSAGQNIAIVWSSPNYFETIKAIDYLFGLWFNEYKDCDMTYIRSFRPNPNKQIEHFTQIVSAAANKVGCALTRYANSQKNVYIVCNYSLTNILNRPIYTSGPPCSACTSGCSAVYPGLCNSNEKIP